MNRKKNKKILSAFDQSVESTYKAWVLDIKNQAEQYEKLKEKAEDLDEKLKTNTPAENENPAGDVDINVLDSVAVEQPDSAHNSNTKLELDSKKDKTLDFDSAFKRLLDSSKNAISGGNKPFVDFEKHVSDTFDGKINIYDTLVPVDIPQVNIDQINATLDAVSKEFDPKIEEAERVVSSIPSTLTVNSSSDPFTPSLSYDIPNPKYEQAVKQLDNLKLLKQEANNQAVLKYVPQNMIEQASLGLMVNNENFKKREQKNKTIRTLGKAAKENVYGKYGNKNECKVRWNIDGKDQLIPETQLDSILRAEEDDFRDYQMKVSEIAKIIGMEGLPESQAAFGLGEAFDKIVKDLFTKEDGSDLLQDKDERLRFYMQTVLDENGKEKEASSFVDNFLQTLKEKPQLEKLNEEEETIEYYKSISQHADIPYAPATFWDRIEKEYPGGKLKYIEDYNPGYDKKWDDRQYQTALSAINEAKRHVRISNEIEGRKDYNGFVEGASNIFFSITDHFSGHGKEDGKVDFLDLIPDVGGYQSMLIDYDIYSHYANAVDKFKNPEATLSYGDEALLKAVALKDIYTSVYNNQQTNSLYKWGLIAAESLDFMLQFIATSGVGSALSTGGKALFRKGASKLLTKGIRNELIDVSTGLIARDGVAIAKNKLAYGLLRGSEIFGRGVGEAAYSVALSNTLQLPRTLSDIYKEYAGDVKGHTDQVTGRYIIDDIEKRKSFSDAFWLTQKRQFVENFSEQLGEWNMFGRLGKVTGISKVFDLLNIALKKGHHEYLIDVAEKTLTGNMSTLEKIFRKGTAFRRGIISKEMLKAGKFFGFWGESMEEFYGIALNHILGSEDDPRVGILDDMKSQAIDIFGGIAVSTGLLGMIGMGSSRYHQHRYNSAKRDLVSAFGKKTANEIERQMIFADYNSISGVVLSLINSFNLTNKEVGKKWFGLKDDADWKESQYEALMRYYGALAQYRGAAFGEDLIEAGIKTVHDRVRKRMKDHGYHLADAEQMDAISAGQKILRQRLAEQLGVSEDMLDAQLEAQGGLVAKINKHVNSGIRDKKERDILNAMLALDNLNNYKAGSDIRILDNAKEAGSRASNRVLRLINEKTKSIVPITDSKGQTHYLINGDIKSKFVLKPQSYSENEDGELQIGANGKVKLNMVGENSVIVDESMYPNNSSFVISDQQGIRRHLTFEEFAKEFKGARMEEQQTNPDILAKLIGARVESLSLRLQNEYFEKQKGINIGKKFKVTDQNGEQVELTVVGFDGRGVRYALKDKEGKTNIHYASKSEFDEMVQQVKDKNTRDITHLFEQKAMEEIEDMMNSAEEVSLTPPETTKPIKKKSRALRINDRAKEIFERKKAERKERNRKRSEKKAEELAKKAKAKAEREEDKARKKKEKLNKAAQLNENETGVRILEAFSKMTDAANSIEERLEALLDDKKTFALYRLSNGKVVSREYSKYDLKDDFDQLMSFTVSDSDDIDYISDVVRRVEDYLNIEEHVVFAKAEKTLSDDKKSQQQILDEFINKHKPLKSNNATPSEDYFEYLLALEEAEKEQRRKEAEEREAQRTEAENKAKEEALKAAEEARRLADEADKLKEEENRKKEEEAAKAEAEKIARREARKKELKAIIHRKIMGQANMFILFDLELLKAFTELSMIFIEEGVRRFSDFCKTMKEELGEEDFNKVRSEMPSVYLCVVSSSEYKDIRSEFDDSATVYEFDIDGFDKQHIVEEVVSDDDQLKTIKTIESDIEKCNNARKATSGFHYFINENGKLQLARRVHSVLGNMRDNWKSTKNLNEVDKNVSDKIVQHWYDNKKDTDKLKDYLYSLVDEYVEKYYNNGNYYDGSEEAKTICRTTISNQLLIDMYIEYMMQDDADISEVAEAISHIIGEHPSNPSTHCGNILDTIGRLFFDYKRDWLFTYENVRNLSSEQAGIFFAGKQTHIFDVKLVPSEQGKEPVYMITKQVFDEIVEQLEVVKEQFKDWKFITDDYYMTSTFLIDGKSVLVGGSTDVIAIDSQGCPHIFDFKTYNAASKSYFDKYFENKAKNRIDIMFSDYTSENDENASEEEKKAKVSNQLYVKNSSDTGKNNMNSRSYAAQYARQVALYRLMFQNRTGLVSKSERLILFGIRHESVKKCVVAANAFKTDVKKTHKYSQPILIPEYVKTDDGFVATGNFVANIVEVGINYLNALAKDDFASRTVLEDVQKLLERVQLIMNDDNKLQMDRLSRMFIVITQLDKQDLPQDLLNAIDSFNSRISSTIKTLSTGITATAPSSADHADLVSEIEKHRLVAQQKRKEEELRKLKLEQEYADFEGSDFEEQFNSIVEELININSDVLTVDNNGKFVTKTQTLTPDYVKAIVDIITEAEYTLKYLFDSINANNNLITEDLYNVLLKYKEYRDSIITKYGILDDVTNIQIWPNRDVILNTAKKKSYSDFAEAKTEPFNVYSSKSEDGKHLLIDAMAKPNFLNSSTIFEVSREGKRYFVTITHDGIKYSKVLLYTSTDNFESLERKFNGKPSDHVEYLDPSCIKRTNGFFVNDKHGANRLFDFFISTEKEQGKLYLYDIEYTDSLNDFGRTARKKINGKPCVVVVKPSKSGENVGTDTTTMHTYQKKDNANPSVGSVVMMVDVPHDEKVNARGVKDRVPVNINSLLFSEGDAQLIVDIFTGKYMKDGAFKKGSTLPEEILGSNMYINGEELPITHGQVLSFLIPYGQTSSVINGKVTTRNSVHLLAFWEQGNLKIRVSGRITGLNHADGRTGITNEVFTLIGNNESSSTFKSFLLKYVRTNISDEIMMLRFSPQDASNDMSNTIFDYYEMNKYVRSHGVKIQFGKSRVLFDSDDFETKAHNPISGLGWYIKNGLLQSPFMNEFERPRMSAGYNGHLKYTSKQNIASDSNKPAEVPGVQPSKKGRVFVKSKPGGKASLAKRDENYKERAKLDPFDEDIALQHIEELLGDLPVYIKEELLSSASEPACLGRCFADCIVLSKQGYKGIEYHEAFHRVLELLLSEDRRKKIYDDYKKQYKSKNRGKTISDRQIAENIADLFMYFMQNVDEYKVRLHWKFWNTFKELYKLIKFMNSIGSIGLYKLFVATKNGKFKNKKPTREQIKRYKKFAGKRGLAFEIGGINSKTIINEEQFEDAINSLAALTLLDSTLQVDDRGLNLKQLSTERETLVNSPDLLRWLGDSRFGTAGKETLIELLGLKLELVKDENDPEDEGQWVVATRTREDGLEVCVMDEDGELWERVRPHLKKFINQFNIKSTTMMDDLMKYLESVEGNPNELDQEYKDTEEDPEEKATDAAAAEEEADTAGKSAVLDHDEKDLYAAIDKASALVKFFFSRVMRTQYSAKDEGDGSCKQEELVTNGLGLPCLWDFKQSWARILSKTYDCQSVHELLIRLAELSEEDPLFTRFYYRFKKVYEAAYVFENTGVTKEQRANNPKQMGAAVRIGIKDADAYGFLNQIVCALRGQKAEYMLVQGLTHDDGTNQTGHVRVIDLNEDFVSAKIRHAWSEMFAAGETTHVGKTEDGEYYVKDELPKDDLKNNVFSRDVDQLKAMIELLEGRVTNNPLKIEVDYIEVIDGEEVHSKKMITPNVNDWAEMRYLKQWFLDKLNDYGIGVTIEELDYALLEYKDFDNPFLQFVNGQFIDSFTTAIDYIKNQIYGKDKSLLKNIEHGTTVTSNLDTIWSNNSGPGSFHVEASSMLALAKFEYAKATKETSVLTVGGKRRYIFTENSYLTDRLDELMKSKLDPSYSTLLQDRMKDNFYMYEDESGIWHGSRVLKLLATASQPPILKYIGIPGFKTNTPGSEGIEFLSESEIEDYVSKYSLLAENYIICPTMSDKTSWGVIRGLSAFGFDFTLKRESGSENNIAYNDRMYQRLRSNTAYYVTRNDDGSFNIELPKPVLKQFLEYAQCEYKQIKDEIARGVKPEDKGSVEFFHRGQEFKNDDYYFEDGKDHLVQLGKRFGSFSGVHVLEDVVLDGVLYKAGDFIDFNKCLDAVERDENGKIISSRWVSEEDNLKTAENFFFNLDEDLQLAIIENELNYAIQEELDKLVEKKLISEINGVYSNKALDKVALNKIGIWQNKNIATNSGETELTPDQTHDAVIGYIADMTMKLLMSMAEISRIYYGNIAYYKWQYDKSTGEYTNSTSDLFKRLGGLVSTGKNNVEDSFIQNSKGEWEIAKEFNVIEVEDVELGSSKKIETPLAKQFFEDAFEQELKQEYAQVLMNEAGITFNSITDKNGQILPSMLLKVDEINKKVEEADVDKIKTILGTNTVSIIENLAKTRAQAINGTNVTDGATYISASMAKSLLIQNGAWNKEMQNAFEILEDESRQADIREQAKALALVTTTFIGMQKYTAYGQRAVRFTGADGVERVANETFYDKTAYAPLFKCTTSGPLRLIYEAMEKGDIHMLKMHSSIKNGSKNVNVITQSDFDRWSEADDKGKAKIVNDLTEQFKSTSYKERFRDVRRQFNTDPKEEEYMAYGTQAIKIMLNALKPNQTYNINGNTYYATQVRDMIMDNIVNLSKIGKQEFEELYTTDGQFDEIKFTEFLRKSISDRDANSELLEAISVKTEEDGSKHMNAPLCALSSTNWIQSIIASKINKKMIDVVTPGAAFYQRSIWGSEGKTLLSPDQVSFTINGGRALLIDNEEHSTDIVLSIDFFDSLFKDHPHLRTNSFEVKKAWLIKNGIISGFVNVKDDYVWKEGDLYESEDGIATEIPENRIGLTVKDTNFGLADSKKVKRIWKHAAANIVGYRIPTQATSSIRAMRCVDVLPVQRHTIMMPKEITATTGSDFDIDKFFLNMLEYIEDERPDVTGKYTEKFLNAYFEYTDDLSTKKKKIYYRNQILLGQLTLLKSADKNKLSLFGAIDDDTTPLKKQAGEILNASEAKSKRLSVYSATSMWRNVDAKMDFATGKSNLGTFALNNNSHALCVLYGVDFHEGASNETLVNFGLTKLSKTKDRYGHPISSWLSGLINAHVDVAKDAYIRRLGVNSYSSNLVNLLIRTGFGKDTFWFTSQPIMKRFYDAHLTSLGVYNQREDISKYSRSKIAVNEEYVAYVKENELFSTTNDKGESVSEPQTLDQALNAVEKHVEKSVRDRFEKQNPASTNKISFNRIQKMIMSKGFDGLHKCSTTPESQLKGQLIPLEDGYEITYEELQATVGYINFALQKHAQQLSDLVKYSKIDTKKHGKTLIEQKAYLQGYEDLRVSETSQGVKNPFVLEDKNGNGLLSMLDRSFIAYKTTSAIAQMENIIGGQLFEGTSGFSMLVEKLKVRLGADRNDAAFVDDLVKMLHYNIKHKFFFDGFDGMPSYCSRRGIDPRELIIGDQSIYSRFMRIKRKIEDTSNPEYADLRTENGMCINYLLRNLIPSTTTTELKDFEEEKEQGLRFSSAANDQYRGAKFISLLNKFEDSVKSNLVTSAWKDLLNDGTHPELQQFAEDLIVYAFMTSADCGGMTDMFKFVPVEWRIGESSCLYSDNKEWSYAKYCKKMLDKYNAVKKDSNLSLPADIDLSNEEMDDLILSFSWNNNIIRSITDSLYKRMTNFGNIEEGGDAIYLLGGHISTSFRRGEADEFTQTFYNDRFPKFFKMQRMDLARSGQRAYVCYQYITSIPVTRKRNNPKLGESPFFVVEIPLYGIVDPNGGRYKGGHKIFDLGVPDRVNPNAQLYQVHKEFLMTGIDGDIVNDPTITTAKQLFEEMLFKCVIEDTMKDPENTEDGFVVEDYSMFGQVRQYLQRAASVTSKKEYQYETPRDRREQEMLRKREIEDQYTALHLENGENSKYKPITYDELPDGLGDKLLGKTYKNMLNGILTKNAPESKINIEFYKKYSEDGKRHSYVITFSLLDMNSKGWLELEIGYDTNAHLFTNEYGVSFHTMSSEQYQAKEVQNDDSTRRATRMMDKDHKAKLFDWIVYSIPRGGVLSASQDLSKADLKLLLTVGVFSGKMAPLDDSKWELANDQEGNGILIPKWRKLTAEEQKVAEKLKVIASAPILQNVGGTKLTTLITETYETIKLLLELQCGSLPY